LEQISSRQSQEIDQSADNPWVFWRHDTVIVIYTDDTIVTGPSEESIEKAIQDISTMFQITHQPKVNDFLGVHIERDDVTGNLRKFETSPAHSEHYRSVVGKLNYLKKSTHPDIAYAVHQCARFSAEPGLNIPRQ
jgi:hypothetical protein